MEIMLEFSKQALKAPVIIHNHSNLTNRTIAYVNEHININLSTKEIADKLSVSESTLRKTFKKEMGVSLGNYIEDIVILNAKQLLKKNNISIMEISEILGFYDQFHFSRRFKEKVNVSPSTYRKRPI